MAEARGFPARPPRYEPADVDTLLSMLGMPPAGVIRDAVADFRASVAFQEGYRLGQEAMRERVVGGVVMAEDLPVIAYNDGTLHGD